MPQSLTYVLQFPGNESTLAVLLWDSLQRASFNECAFVSPFASEGGVNTIVGMCDRLGVGNRTWVVGLDGVITSPDALAAIMRDRKSTVKRAWRMGAEDYLHAKVFFFWNVAARRAVLYIGSGNATAGGLKTNIEAGVLVVASGKSAGPLIARIRTWLSELLHSGACLKLSPTLLKKYKRTYALTRRQAASRRIARLVGVEAKQGAKLPLGGRSVWIEVAVRGGASNQIEICKPMAPFFTGGRETPEVDFDVVDARTGALFVGNAYRFRPGNFGYRVEVNAKLAKSLDLSSAARRRDIVLFRKAPGKQYVIELHRSGSPAAKRLVRDGERAGRVHRTIRGTRGRKYFM